MEENKKDKILFETIVTFGKKKNDTLLTITDSHLLFQKKKGLFKKVYKVVEDIDLNNIKVINDKVKIKQRKEKITIYTKNETYDFKCKNILEATKVVEIIKKEILGDNIVVRTANAGKKVAKAVGKTVAAIGGTAIVIGGTVKAIYENKDKVVKAVKTIGSIIKKH